MPPRSSMVTILLSGWERFLAQALRTTFLALLLRLLGPVCTRIRSCCDRWKGELSVRDTPYIHCAMSMPSYTQHYTSTMSLTWHLLTVPMMSPNMPMQSPVSVPGTGTVLGRVLAPVQGTQSSSAPATRIQNSGLRSTRPRLLTVHTGPWLSSGLQPANCAVTSSNLEKLY